MSCGIGALAIFGSYIGKERKLTGEAVNILVLDTCVALIAGLIIFPACSAYGIDPGEGPGLVFVTLPNVFNHMAGGRIWGRYVFPVYDLCGPDYDYRCIPEYYFLCYRSLGLELKEGYDY